MKLQKSISSKGLLCLLTLFLVVNYESQAQEAPVKKQAGSTARQKPVWISIMRNTIKLHWAWFAQMLPVRWQHI